MAARDWLKDVNLTMREAHDRAMESIVEMQGIDDPTSRVLLARSWGKVAHDLSSAGEEPDRDEMLRHVSGDMFMDALAADGDAMLVTRKLKYVEEGSDDWTSMNGDLERFRRVEGCLRKLSAACESLRAMVMPDCTMPTMHTFAVGRY